MVHQREVVQWWVVAVGQWLEARWGNGSWMVALSLSGVSMVVVMSIGGGSAMVVMSAVVAMSRSGGMHSAWRRRKRRRRQRRTTRRISKRKHIMRMTLAKHDMLSVVVV